VVAISTVALTACAGAVPASPKPTPSPVVSATAPASVEPTATATPPAQPEADQWLRTFAEGHARSAATLGVVRKGPPPIFGKMDDTFPSLHGWTDGQVVRLHIVLSPAHADERACAAPEALDGLRCSFVEGGKRASDAPPFPEADLLQPHWTTDGQRLLGAGLWSSPALTPVLAERLDRAVTLACDVRILGRAMVQFRLREDDTWMGAAKPWDYGRFESCELASWADAPKPPGL